MCQTSYTLSSGQNSPFPHQHKNTQGNGPTNRKPYKKGKNGIPNKTANIGGNGNGNHGRYKTGNGSAYPGYMANGLHGNSPEVTKYKAQGKKLQRQESNQNP